MHDIDLKDKSLYEIPLNQYQSTFEELNLLSYPDEVQEQFFDYITNVPMIKYMIGNDRKRACDLERDEEGKIIVDITKPHILEDMDYFRPAANHYQRYGCYTNLRPNPNPNSEYGKWIREELRRCYKGYVRESDGEWIPGTMYFFLNYCPIQQTKFKKGSKKGDRVIDFPAFWEGIYYRYHYLDQAEKGGYNGCEISRRGSGKSLTIAAIFARNFVLGLMDSDGKIIDHVKSMAVAYSKEYLVTDGILTKFQAYIDFLAQNTQFPSKRITQSMQNMMWKAGYLDLDTQTQKGTLNELFGVSVKDDPAKVRGKRIHFVCFEEFKC
jgi:hypothetical protein